MRALSLTQPWASWGILALGKSVENRQRWKNCHYRGEVALHAAQGIKNHLYFSEIVDEIRRITGAAVPTTIARATPPRFEDWEPSPELPRGAIVGLMRIAGVVTPDGLVNENAIARDVMGNGRDVPAVLRREMRQAERRWWQGGFGLMLADVRPLSEPVPCKGALGLWRVPADVEADVRRRAA